MEIKNHEIILELSRGAITTVYKALHLNLDRPVLLKVLNAQWLSEKDLLERFKREAKISAKLEHPNIVKVYDFNVSPTQVFISMEYIDGHSLTDYIKLHHPINIQTLQKIIKNIISAITYAHQKGIIHRDIKPGNIIIDRDENAYLTDFGLASMQDVDQITQQGQLTGTPAYLAPERVKGKPATQESDLYSLGITFYEMVSGRSPFQKDNTAATLQSILTENVPAISREELPDWLIFLIKRLTKKHPEQRKSYIDIFRKKNKLFNENEIAVKNEKKSYAKIYAYLAMVAVIVFLYFFVKSSNMDVDHSLPKDSLSLSEKNYINKERMSSKDDKIKEIDFTNTIPVNTKKVIENHDDSTSVYLYGTRDKDSIKTVVKYGGLVVRCTPWANVYINNDSVDTTPMYKPVSLKTGYYELVLKNPNFKNIRQSIKIKANLIDTLSFQLEETHGYLLIQATPWASIYINNEYKEDTPLQNPILVTAGENIIELINPHYESIYDTIYIEAGKRIQKQYSFAD